MKDLKIFEQFAPKNTDKGFTGNNAVIYTRVSDISQEDNTSLESQHRICTSFAISKGFTIVENFGGTYESAKTDERKEFGKMLQFVKRTKVTYIIVYSYERFTRSGVSGAFIAHELMKKHKIVILSATQGIDPTTSTGAFQQNLMFLVGHLDNEQRREKTILGITELVEKGFCAHGLPRGFTNLNKGKAKYQQIVVNEQGKLLRKAFHWKADEQMKNSEILKRLALLGLKLDERRLGEMFANPFYCGLITSSLLPGKVFEGKHEPLVSRDIFLRVNNVISDARVHSVTHKKEDENLPLKRFTKCGTCETPMTGFLVRKKGLYYYKCRTKGCSNSKNAKQLHELFCEMLELFKIDETESEFIKQGIKEFYATYFAEQFETQTLQKSNLSQLKNKLETIEENFVTGEINKELFHKYSGKYLKEIAEIEAELQKVQKGSSNLEKCLDFVVKFCEKPLKWWESAKIWERSILQNLMFPNGILYDPKKGALQTTFVNALFAPIPELKGVLRGCTKKGKHFKVLPRMDVTAEGF